MLSEAAVWIDDAGRCQFGDRLWQADGSVGLLYLKSTAPSAKWTFLESLGLFNTPLGLKVTLLVLPGWRWRWCFGCESGFGEGETSSLDWNWLHHLPLKLMLRLPEMESNSRVLSLSFSLFFWSVCLSLYLRKKKRKSMNLTSTLAGGAKQISLAWPSFWEFWPPAEAFITGFSSADAGTQRKWRISHITVCFNRKKGCYCDWSLIEFVKDIIVIDWLWWCWCKLFLFSCKLTGYFENILLA